MRILPDELIGKMKRFEEKEDCPTHSGRHCHMPCTEREQGRLNRCEDCDEK